MKFTWAAVAVMVPLLAGGSADASVIGHAVYTPVAGPVFSGDGAAWVERRADGGLMVRAADAAGVERTVAQYPVEPQTRFDAAISGSRSWLALELGRNVAGLSPGSQDRSVQAFAGRPGGGLAELSPNCPKRVPELLRSVDIDGEVLAFGGPECGQGSLRDADGSTRRAYPDGVSGLRVAGRFIAWIEPFMGGSSGRSVVVADSASGREVLRFRPKAVASVIGDIDLDADGTVVVSFLSTDSGGRSVYRLAVASPADPRPRVIGPAVAAATRIATGRVIAFATSQLRGVQRVLVLDARSGRTLDASPAGAFVERSPVGFDVDGERVASLVRECHRVAIDVGSRLPDLSDRRAPCRLRFARRPVRRDRHLRLRVSCAGFSVDCEARVTVRWKGRTLAVRTSEQGGQVALPLSRAERRRLPRRARLRFTAVYGKYDGGSRPLHGGVRQTATVRIRHRRPTR